MKKDLPIPAPCLCGTKPRINLDGEPHEGRLAKFICPKCKRKPFGWDCDYDDTIESWNIYVEGERRLLESR